MIEPDGAKEREMLIALLKYHDDFGAIKMLDGSVSNLPCIARHREWAKLIRNILLCTGRTIRQFVGEETW